MANQHSYLIFRTSFTPVNQNIKVTGVNTLPTPICIPELKSYSFIANPPQHLLNSINSYTPLNIYTEKPSLIQLDVPIKKIHFDKIKSPIEGVSTTFPKETSGVTYCTSQREKQVKNNEFREKVNSSNLKDNMTNIGNIAVKTYFQEQNVWKPENESSRGLFEYNRKQKIKSCKHRVKFEPMNNKIIIINSRSFYNENDIKKDVWWTTAELNNMRNLLIAEVNRLKTMNPQWSVQHCIREICKK